MTTETAARTPMPSTATPGRWGFGHLPALDGLRGAAVVAVLVYHGGYLEGGYLGVDLFFVLSGFLITSLLLHEFASEGAIELRSFWYRRFRRLLPAVVVLVLGVALYAHLAARAVDLDTIRADGLATLAYVANWHTIWQGTSYWDISLAPSPFQHTWSLAIEEQFYLAWPFVVALLARRATRGAGARSLERTILHGAGTAAVASAVWAVALYAWGASDTRVYQGTDTRAAALLAGAALAAWVRLHPAGGRRARVRAGSVGGAAAVALAAMWVLLPGTSPLLFRGGLAMAGVLATVVVWSIAVRARGPIDTVLTFPPLRWLGFISYGLYLWHWPLFGWVEQHNGELPLLGDRVLEGPGLFLVKVLVSLAAALASYALVERPIRRGRARGVVPALAGLGAVALAAMVLVVATAGAVDVPGQQAPVAQDSRRYVVGGPDVVFVGDSVAASLVSPVIDDPEPFGINPVNRTYPGCSPVGQGRPVRNFAGRPIEPQPCFRELDEELADLDPDLVIVDVGSRPNDEVSVDGEWVGACDPAFDEVYREAMVDLVERLGATGAPVVLSTIARTSDNVLVRVPESDDRIACANEQLAAVADRVDHVSLVDINELVCPEEGCVERLEGDDVRPDGIHFSDGPAGRAVAAWVVERALEHAELAPGFDGVPEPGGAPED